MVKIVSVFPKTREDILSLFVLLTTQQYSVYCHKPCLYGQYFLISIEALESTGMELIGSGVNMSCNQNSWLLI